MSNVKVTTVSERSIPRFIRDEYPQFVEFVKAYYQFLDENGYMPVIKDLKDVDSSLDKFSTYLINELTGGLPPTVVPDNFVATRIKDLYEAKGTSAAYKFLFRLLYGKGVELRYPKDSILRTSDGKWKQDLSIFVESDNVRILEISGKTVQFRVGIQTFSTVVDRVRTVTTTNAEGVTTVVPNTYELFIDRTLYGKIPYGTNVIFAVELGIKASVISTAIKINILDGGKGFKAGQLYSIGTSTGTPTIIKVTRTDSLGSILGADIVIFGNGYFSDFRVSIVPQDGADTVNLPYVISGSSPTFNATMADDVSNISDSGYVNRIDYAQTDTWDGSYAGAILAQFNDRLTTDGDLDPETVASFFVTIGGTALYSGYYTSNDGFLSDSIVLQDGDYYQTFSYVMVVTESIKNYGGIVKKLIHPGGMKMFGEYELLNDIEVGVFVEALAKVLAINKVDEVTTFEEIFKSFFKVLTDEVNTSETVILALNKLLSDVVTTSDSGYTIFNPYFVHDDFYIEFGYIDVPEYF